MEKYAFIYFEKFDNALYALNTVHNTSHFGCLLQCFWSKSTATALQLSAKNKKSVRNDSAKINKFVRNNKYNILETATTRKSPRIIPDRTNLLNNFDLSLPPPPPLQQFKKARQPNIPFIDLSLPPPPSLQQLNKTGKSNLQFTKIENPDAYFALVVKKPTINPGNLLDLVLNKLNLICYDSHFIGPILNQSDIYFTFKKPYNFTPDQFNYKLLNLNLPSGWSIKWNSLFRNI